ncbi:MAG: hypothetical protein ACXVDW_14175, partial [Bacteroidia bacterium]
KLAAVARLKSRLFYFVLEVLSADNLLRREELYDPCDKQIVRIRKKMLQFRVIYRKKNRADFLVLIHLLNEIIKESKEYEQYDIIVEALIFKKYLLMLRKSNSEVEEIEEKISFYSQAHQMVIKATDHYFNIITNQEVVNKLKPQQKLKLLKTTINELNGYIKQTNSPSIAYTNKLLELEYLFSTKNYKNNALLCYGIIEHLNKHRHLYRDERMGFAYDNISLCQVYNHDFSNAILNCQKAQTFYDPKGNVSLSSKQQEFYIHFYSGNYKAANETVKELLNFSIVNSGDFRYDKFQFFKACTLFQLGNYEDALAICSDKLEICKDKGRWDIGVRYLKLMCLVELNEFDKAHKIVDALRKILIRNKKIVSSRDELIYKMLNEYARKGFYLADTSKFKTAFNKLSAGNSANSWNYYTHELIPIHTWIKTKIDLRTPKS